MTGFALKLIAIVTMLIDHLGAEIIPEGLFGTQNVLLRLIGRIAMPLFCFLLAEGYRHTSNKKRYITTMFVFALISEIPYDLLFYGEPFFWGSQNVYFTLGLGLLAMHFYETYKGQPLGLVFPLGIAFAAELLGSDYGAMGIILMMLFYISHQDKQKMVLLFVFYNIVPALPILYLVVAGGLSWFDFFMITLQVWSLLALIPILFYNGERGYRLNKYIFYWFYPVHLLVLYLIQ